MRLLLLLFAVCFLSGCDKKTTVEDMPAIVFAESVNNLPHYGDEPSLLEGVPMYETTFIDSKGDIYFLANDYLSEYNFNMISEYEEGKLKDKLKLIGKCDVEKVLQNYKRLLSVVKNEDSRLVEPIEGPAIETEEISVNGVYREEGEVKVIELYKYSRSVSIESSDKTARKIVSWFRDVIEEAREKK